MDGKFPLPRNRQEGDLQSPTGLHTVIPSPVYINLMRFTTLRCVIAVAALLGSRRREGDAAVRAAPRGRQLSHGTAAARWARDDEPRALRLWRHEFFFSFAYFASLQRWPSRPQNNGLLRGHDLRHGRVRLSPSQRPSGYRTRAAARPVIQRRGGSCRCRTAVTSRPVVPAPRSLAAPGASGPVLQTRT
jgi:hypothetical protein